MFSDILGQILIPWSLLTWITIIFFHPGPQQKKLNQNETLNQSEKYFPIN